MQSQALLIGVVMFVFGVISLVFNLSTTWMWVFVIVGIVAIVWGLLPTDEKEAKGEKGDKGEKGSTK